MKINIIKGTLKSKSSGTERGVGPGKGDGKGRVKGKLAVAVVIILLVAGAVIYSSLKQQIKVDAGQLTTAALENMAALTSYSFTSSTQLINGEQQSYAADITGEVQGEKKRHICGTILQTPIEIYLVDDKTYLKNEVSDSWLITESDTLLRTELLVAELNPLQHLQFTAVGEVLLQDVIKDNGRQLALVTLQPQPASPLLDMAADSFTYQLWIDIEQQLITRLDLQAVGRENSQTQISMTIEFADFNSNELQIKAPPTA